MRDTINTRLCGYRPSERHRLNAAPPDYTPRLDWVHGCFLGQPALSVTLSPDGGVASSRGSHVVMVHKAPAGAWVLSLSRVLGQYFDTDLLEWSPPYEYDELARGLPTVEAAQWLAEGWSKTGILQALEAACIAQRDRIG